VDCSFPDFLECHSKYGSFLKPLKSFSKASDFYNQSWCIQYVPSQRVHPSSRMRRFCKDSDKNTCKILAMMNFLLLTFHGSTHGTCHRYSALHSIFSSTGKISRNMGFFRYYTLILAEQKITNSIQVLFIGIRRWGGWSGWGGFVGVIGVNFVWCGIWVVFKGLMEELG